MTTTNTAPAQKLRQTAAAVKVQFSWFGNRKTIDSDNKESMSDAVSADHKMVSAQKTLLGKEKGSPLKALAHVRSQIRRYWAATTLPYVEDGIRLIRQADVAVFDAKMGELRTALKEAELSLEMHYDEERQKAKERLGDLFNPNDYPKSMLAQFDVEWSFPSVEPPDYLLTINPALYEQEQKRVAAKFEQAVALAEQQFTNQLALLVQRLADSLEPGEDGKKRMIKSSAVENFVTFFDTFQKMNVGSSTELDGLVAQAKALVSGLDVKELRTSDTLKVEIGTGLAAIEAKLAHLTTVQPRRKVVKPKKAAPAAEVYDDIANVEKHNANGITEEFTAAAAIEAATPITVGATEEVAHE